VSRAAGLPERTARLFPDQQVLPAEGRGLLIERILEDGNGDDLRWLTSEITETDIAAWVSRTAPRKLSRRSRAYWTLVLGVPAAAPAQSAVALWPLA